MTLLPNSLEARDVAYYFHPATNARRHERLGPLVMESGRGVYVRDDQGKEYLEGLAGLWSVAVGFGEPRLVEAAARQMAKLPYYHSFSGKSHPQAIALAERLVNSQADGSPRRSSRRPGRKPTTSSSSSSGIITTRSAGRKRRRSSAARKAITASRSPRLR